jgi:uncharacterized metal-binding protein
MAAPCNGNGEKLIFPCGGRLHCGQVAARVGELLREDGIGQVVCLAAIAGRVPDKLERARCAPMRIAIDGCEDHCARRTLELAGSPADVHVVLTSLGIEKSPAHPDLLGDATRAIERLRFAVTG